MCVIIFWLSSKLYGWLLEHSTAPTMPRHVSACVMCALWWFSWLREKFQLQLSPPNDNHLLLCHLLHTSSSSVAPMILLSSENSMHTLLDGWMDGWSSHPQTGGSSVLGLLGLGRCSTSSCRLAGMAITRHTGNGTHLVSGSLLWVILFFVLASILLVTLLWICLSGLLWRQLQGR